MWRRLLIVMAIFSPPLWAQEESPAPVADQSARDPAQDTIPGKKATDEELRVQAQLPEALAKKDAHSMQLEVYKSLFNKDLKPDQREDVEE